MNLRAPLSRSLVPARWRRLVVGLLATLALSFQAGVALAHTHADFGTSLEASASAADMAGAPSADQDRPGQPTQHDAAAQCPLCHSPLSHGGILAANDSLVSGLVRYTTDNALPPSQAPPTAAFIVNPPVRGPPLSI